MISFIKELEKNIVDLGLPIVSDYTLFLQAYRISKESSYHGAPLYKQKHSLTREKAVKLIYKLQDYHIIRKDGDFRSGIFRVNDVADKGAEDVCALADPFCYLSHLSAMARYGFTDRIPAQLNITTPTRSIWCKLKDSMVERDFGFIPNPKEIISMRKYGFAKKVRGISIVKHESKFVAKTKPIKGTFARISEIGDTFVDMLSTPSMCGGMEHVLEVWQNNAPSYLDEIINSVNQCPIKIIKVRAGYILDEFMKIKDNRVQEWLSVAQRGGSQLLNPEKPYEQTFSEKWMISLNA
jgi:predicted transcriptional regulator of viral defense system